MSPALCTHPRVPIRQFTHHAEMYHIVRTFTCSLVCYFTDAKTGATTYPNHRSRGHGHIFSLSSELSYLSKLAICITRTEARRHGLAFTLLAYSTNLLTMMPLDAVSANLMISESCGKLCHGEGEQFNAYVPMTNLYHLPSTSVEVGSTETTVTEPQRNNSIVLEAFL